MERYLIDTNVVSGYFSASFSTSGMDFMDSIIDSIPNLSVITQIELLCWDSDTNTMQKVKDFIADSLVLGIDDNTIAQCVLLRKGKKIKTPDAIIAASALANGYTIVTVNERDFVNIRDWKL